MNIGLSVAVVCLALAGFGLLLAVARHANLTHPVRATCVTSVAAVLFSLLLFALSLRLDESHVVIGYIATAVQVPGILLPNFIGFGFHSEVEQLRVYFILIVGINAIAYGTIGLRLWCAFNRRSQFGR